MHNGRVDVLPQLYETADECLIRVLPGEAVEESIDQIHVVLQLLYQVHQARTEGSYVTQAQPSEVLSSKDRVKELLFFLFGLRLGKVGVGVQLAQSDFENLH